jgi:abortive infection bacteriophage resistance protein
MEAHQGGFFIARRTGVKYTKPALSTEQQLELLVRRGMAVADRQVALQYLDHINYYRLRAYWLPDELPATADGDHAFKAGTRFETIIDLYSFDRKLRLLVMDAIERMEVSLRTRWANILALRYAPHAYLDASLFRKPTQHAKCLTKLQEELDRSRETFVLHYRAKYTDPELPPLWGVCELLTFGQLSQWYSNLAKGTDRKEIAEPYGVDEQIIVSFAHHLAYVRNVCAHHMRLWNRDMTIGMTIPHNPQWLGKAFNHAKPKRVYNTLVMLVHLLDRISPRSQWRQHLLGLFDEHSVVDFSAMGFPTDWRSSVIWEARS